MTTNSMKCNLALELLDHHNLKTLLQHKAAKLRQAAVKIEVLVNAMTAADFDWENVSPANIETVQKLVDTILDYSEWGQ